MERSDNILLPAREGISPRNPEILWQSFSLVFQHMFKNGREIKLRNDEGAFESGMSANDIFLVINGYVTLQRLNRDGSLVVSSVALPGDIIGQATGEIYPWSAQAVGDTTLRAVPKANFDKVVGENGPMTIELVKNLENQLQQSRELMAMKDSLNVTKKVASFLLWFQKNSQGKSHFKTATADFPFSAHRLASTLGCSREMISRSTKTLIDLGLISPSRARKEGAYGILNSENLKRFIEM